MSDTKYKTREYKAGEVLIHEGDVGDCAFLIQSGQVEIFKEHDGQEKILTRLGAGEIFGETALVFDETRSASVRGYKDGNLIVISRILFKKKLAGTDPTVKAIVSMLSRRILAGNQALLKEQKDISSLIQAVQILFENVRGDLPVIKQRIFEQKARPHFDAFVEAIESLETYIDEDGEEPIVD